MKNIFLLAGILFLFAGCNNCVKKSEKEIKTEVTELLNNWHKAAADANEEDYFSMIAPEGIFLGTDPTENWVKKDFRDWAKPFFDRGKAWAFTPHTRNIYIADNRQFVWFNELLDTPFGTCRGSGVISLIDGKWYINHYNLAITLPNEKMKLYQDIILNHNK